MTLLSLLPTAVQLLAADLTQHRAIDLTFDPNFQVERAWRLEQKGKASASFVGGGDDRHVVLDSLQAGSGNATLVYEGAKPEKPARIGSNTVLRISSNQEFSTGALSYLSLATLVLWQNRTVIPVTVVLGESAPSAERVLPSGVLIVRDAKGRDEWVDYILKLDSTLPLVVQHLRNYTRGISAELKDDYRVLGMSVTSVNARVKVRALSIAEIAPASLILSLRSNSILPMSILIGELRVNDRVLPIRVEGSLFPFSQSKATSILPFPVTKGDRLDLSLSMHTGQQISARLFIREGPIWV